MAILILEIMYKQQGGDKILMDKNIGMKKGEHERSMRKAKEMIDKGCGMGEVVAETHLRQEDVIKAKEKWVDQS